MTEEDEKEWIAKVKEVDEFFRRTVFLLSAAHDSIGTVDEVNIPELFDRLLELQGPLNAAGFTDVTL